VIFVAAERQPDRRHRDSWVEAFSRTSWSHVDQDSETPAITIALPAINSASVLVVVDEGDNMPLPLTGARLLLPSYRVRFFREKNAALRLAYGSSAVPPPRYDLALVAPQLLGVTATDVAATPEGTSHDARSLPALVSPRLFWTVLVLAVIVLLMLIVRLLRKTQPL